MILSDLIEFIGCGFESCRAHEAFERLSLRRLEKPFTRSNNSPKFRDLHALSLGKELRCAISKDLDHCPRRNVFCSYLANATNEEFRLLRTFCEQMGSVNETCGPFSFSFER